MPPVVGGGAAVKAQLLAGLAFLSGLAYNPQHRHSSLVLQAGIEKMGLELAAPQPIRPNGRAVPSAPLVPRVVRLGRCLGTRRSQCEAQRGDGGAGKLFGDV